MSVKALRTQFIAAIAMLLVASLALGSSTFAWFSMNRTVTATNMQVKAVASSSLAINTNANVGTLTTVTVGTSVQALIPATHYNSTKHSSATGTNEANLVAVSNLTDVDAATGLQSDGKTLSYKYAENTADDVYYIDYIVYIASAGTALEGQDLKAQLYMDSSTWNAYETRDTRKAVSVDFLVNDSYSQTINLSTMTSDATYGVITASKTLASNTTIPQNSTGSIKVTLRVYFDGALEQSPGNCYVFSNVVKTDNVSFSCLFTADTYVNP